MFLKKTLEENPRLMDLAFDLHQSGRIQPDSYVIDLDTLLENAKNLLAKAKENQIELFFMLKQLGRNPFIAKRLVELGYSGAVVVDYKEAGVMMEAGIPIGNVGHLVQIPQSQIGQIIAYGPRLITVFSLEKIISIQREAKKQGKVQSILLRVFGEEDMVYSGQTAGFHLDELPKLVNTLRMDCPNVAIAGVTSFPCYLYDEAKGDFVPTKNMETVQQGVHVLETLGVHCRVVNTPSGTCCHTLEPMRLQGGNCGEPGHGLTGTTPMHAVQTMEEKPCVVYVSEISHNFYGRGYCYGGGHYRRSHLSHVLVGRERWEAEFLDVIPPADDSIDYHFGISKECRIGDTALMAFRFQIFVTRSDVVLVTGLRTGNPEIIGIYDSLGGVKWENGLL